MSEEAMKLALEALENSVDLVREDAYQAEKLYGNYPTRQGKVNGLKVLADDHEKAITALREALAEQPAPVQGWKLVPYALTPEMSHIVETEMEGRDFAVFWRDLLNAAPQPAQHEEDLYDLAVRADNEGQP